MFQLKPRKVTYGKNPRCNARDTNATKALYKATSATQEDQQTIADALPLDVLTKAIKKHGATVSL